MESRTGAFRRYIVPRRFKKKAHPQTIKSTWFVALFLIFFMGCVLAYGRYVEINGSAGAGGGAIRIGLELGRETHYGISLAALASYNNLDQSMVDPAVLEADPAGKFEFMSLKWVDGVTAQELAAMLEGRGVLEGHAQDFLDAAKAYNINPVYFVAHARLESGNGTSELACGVYVQAGKQKDSYGHSYNVDKSGVYYNLFGIRAYDANPVHDGSLYAAGQKWDTVAAAIRGGAQWLSENYINRSQAALGSYDQDTLYQMRFDPYGWASRGSGHEYATDQKWAHSIAGIMAGYQDILGDSATQYNIPAFNG